MSKPGDDIFGDFSIHTGHSAQFFESCCPDPIDAAEML